MHVTRRIATVAAFAVALSTGAAFAQDHHDAYVKHDEWKKGYHMQQNDWGRGQQVDWRAHHLHQPPNGYEWRQVDGNYVMANVSTGVIGANIVIAK